MSRQFLSFFLALNILDLLIGIIDCSSVVRRLSYDARLYEHFQFDSRYIQYVRTEPEKWQDIPDLIASHNFTYHSMICTYGPGAWIFYPGTNYEMGNFQLYYFVLGEHCVRADDVNSIQPLGDSKTLLEHGVILFGKPEFGTLPTAIIRKFETSAEAESMIFTGSIPFLIEGGGKKIGLRPSMTLFERGYCLFPNIKSTLGISGPVTVRRIYEDDDLADVIDLRVENCYTDGVHEQYADQDLSIAKLNQVCPGGSGGDDVTKRKLSIVLDIWGKRIQDELHTINKPPVDYLEVAKLDLFSKILTIFEKVCPDVDPLYIYAIRQLFLSHIEKIWEKTKAKETAADKVKQGDALISMYNVTLYCLDHEMQLKRLVTPCSPTSVTALYGSTYDPEYNQGPKIPDSEFWYEIVNGQKFDPAIEQTWLMINTAMAACNKLEGYVTNNWADMFLGVHQYFLNPLKEQWADPGEWTKVYQAALHGYDIRKEHRKIVDCLEHALRNSLSFDPIGRPKYFDDIALYKYAIPKEGALPKQKRSPPLHDST